MIIAWIFFLLGVFLFGVALSVVLSDETPGKNFNRLTIFSIFSIAISAQYIWG